jgi:hypothetical protein
LSNVESATRITIRSRTVTGGHLRFILVRELVQKSLGHGQIERGIAAQILDEVAHRLGKSAQQDGDEPKCLEDHDSGVSGSLAAISAANISSMPRTWRGGSSIPAAMTGTRGA